MSSIKTSGIWPLRLCSSLKKLFKPFQNLTFSRRYLFMESCQGSMLNYCRKNLDDSVVSAVKGIDIMWQVTCGVDYLHRNKISHGDLNLENVLFWRRDLKSKRVVVKITGYGYIKDFQPRVCRMCQYSSHGGINLSFFFFFARIMSKVGLVFCIMQLQRRKKSFQMGPLRWKV